ncbi:2-hydroxyacid dehydrogenase [Desmospora profundinema]|uniref:Glyoxylate reductase n=1 Tax=Desmospora profundinema TaxID=1571184 RepID=A0ABU1IMQ1_9BACL|nr:D-glycerate dehydrogenase [Desmospora profundinema]MDR6225239.1 glyoxylate reductase [Desmospora profundinema]
MSRSHRPRVLVTREIPDEGLQLLQKHCDVSVGARNRGMDRDELLSRAPDYDGILSMLTDAMDAPLMERCPSLKVISNYAVGVDNVDLKEAQRRGIAVTHTPDVLTDATADLAWALLMDIARRVTEGDRLNRAGGWKTWSPFFHLGREVTGATLGIVGMGRIGQAVAKRARGFDMRLLYHSRSPLPAEREQEWGAERLPLEDLLQEADFVSLHAPYTPKTHHLIGKRELQLMKRDAYLINTSRGGLVDEGALVEALRSGEIAGAGLDVYEREPEMAEGLAQLENVVLAPHLGSATRETRGRMARVAAENLVAELVGVGRSRRVRLKS